MAIDTLKSMAPRGALQPIPEYTEEDLQQLEAFGSDNSDSHIRNFVARQDLTDNVVLTVASVLRSEEHRVELGRRHADSLPLAQLALKADWPLVTRAMVQAKPSPGVRQIFFDHSERPAVAFGLHEIKRAGVRDRREDSEFIEEMSEHACEMVRAEAAKYVVRDTAIKMLKDTSGASWEQRRIVIDRFPDDPEVADIVTSPFRRQQLGNLDTANHEEQALASATKRRETAVLLRTRSDTLHSAADVIAVRWADDLEMASWFLNAGVALGALAQHTKQPEVLAKLRGFVVNEPLLSTGARSLQLIAAGRHLAKRMPNDVELAAALGNYPEYVIRNIVEATSSREVLLALAKGSQAQYHSEVRRGIRDKAGTDAEISEILENARLTGIERMGGVTVRSVAEATDIADVLSALQHDNAAIRDGAKQQLRALSAAHREATAGQPSPTPGPSTPGPSLELPSCR